MASKKGFSVLVLSLLSTLAASQQQAILSDGNGQLPACAQSCQKLIQASQACSGTTTASQQAWVCFCQSGYLAALRQSAATICPTECTSQADLAQISTWYNSNCGSDNGMSEHQGNGATASSSAPASNGQSSSTNVAASAASTSAGSPDGTSSSNAQTPPKDWWSGHYQWIIMVIVLIIVLPAIGVLGHWLKRRYDRRRDQSRNGFNAGITSRSGPMGNSDQRMSGIVGNVEGNGRNSTARTRDAFMPYGYGYNRSESGLDSRYTAHDDRRSPLPGHGTPDIEKEAAVGAPDTEPSKKKPKRVLVRERSGPDSVVTEKRSGS